MLIDTKHRMYRFKDKLMMMLIGSKRMMHRFQDRLMGVNWWKTHARSFIDNLGDNYIKTQICNVLMINYRNLKNW